MKKNNKFVDYGFTAVSISKFMSIYYNISGKELNKLTHNDLNEIFPFIEPVNANKSDIEEIADGRIILVEDIKNKVRGYKNPLMELDREMKEEDIKSENAILTFAMNKDEIKNCEITQSSIENLNIYNLEKLLKVCKEKNEYKKVRMLERELYFRPENHSKEKKVKKMERILKDETRRETKDGKY